MLKKIVNNTANGIVNNFSIANLITVIGLILDLWNNWLIYNGTRGLLPLFLLWAVPFTDFLDGLVARRRKAETYVGGALDPVRDKVYAFSKFYFIIVGFLAVYSQHPYLVPLAIVVYCLLGFLELLLLLAGAYGICKGREVKANKWGKYKFASECLIISLIWGVVFFVSPWGLTLANNLILLPLILLPIFPIYLALKSLDGHIIVLKRG